MASTGGPAFTWSHFLGNLRISEITAGKIQEYRIHRHQQAIAERGKRAWFSPEEYKKLYQATRKRAQEPKKKGFQWESEQLHDYVLFAVNTGLRPDEAGRLEFRDVTIVDDEDLGKTILDIEVRGKRGVGYCKSMPVQ